MPEESEIQRSFLDHAITRAKQEILADIAAGTMPAGVNSFAALHEHVDANCYAGCCDDSTVTELRGLDLWNSVFPPKAEEDEEVLGSAATLDAMNAMHTALNGWLAAGGHRTPASA